MYINYDYQIFNEQVYGGISRYFCELASRIDRLPAAEVKILAGWHSNRYLEKFSPQLTLGHRRPQVAGLNRLLNGVSYRRNRLWSDWCLRQHPPDILHHTYYDPSPQSYGAARVLTIYDMIHEHFQESLPPKEFPVIAAKARAVAAADWIICPSENTKQDLQKFCQVDADKISVIYHGCGMLSATVQWPAAEWLERPYILYVGKRCWYKNFDRLLQAYAHRFSQDFQLVCFGSQAFSKTEQQRIAALGLNSQQVRWTSGSDSLLRGFYQQAALFVYPSLYEGFGYPPLEAMSYRCPVACSNTSCFSETVANAAQLFDPNQVDSIIEALDRVLSSNFRRAELIELSQQRLQLFSWQSCAEQHYQLYQSLVS